VNERLESLLRRYDEISALIQDPDLAKDQKRYRDLMKEYSQLGALAAAQGEIETISAQLEDAKTLVMKDI
jgi:peptide chain release factor 1